MARAAAPRWRWSGCKGWPDDPRIQAILRRYLPNKVVLLREPDDDAPITELAEFTRYQYSLDGQPTAYVCRNVTIQRLSGERGFSRTRVDFHGFFLKKSVKIRLYQRKSAFYRSLPE